MNADELDVLCGYIDLGIEGAVLHQGRTKGGDLYIQVRFPAQAPYDGCRKWFISDHMTISEVVQTAFLAAMTALEHELREKFRFMDKDIFNPHQNAVYLARDAKIPHDVRE